MRKGIFIIFVASVFFWLTVCSSGDQVMGGDQACASLIPPGTIRTRPVWVKALPARSTKSGYKEWCSL